MNIKTTDKGAEIIELIQFIVNQRNTTLGRINLLDAREARNGSLTTVEEYCRERSRLSIARYDYDIEALRDSLDREHLSMVEALGVW